MLSLAGDAFLLLLDERTGKPAPDWWQLDRVLAGAVLADLETARRITISNRFADSVRGLSVLVTDRKPTATTFSTKHSSGWTSPGTPPAA